MNPQEPVSSSSAAPDRPRVLVTRALPDGVAGALAERFAVDVYEGPRAMPRDEFLRRSGGAEGILALLTERIDDELLDAAGPQLVIVANYAVGFDNVDVPACTGRGVMVSNTPDVLTETTADMAWALMLAAARRVGEGERLLRSGDAWIWDPRMMLGVDVHGKTLGLVGFGRIGRAMAPRAAGFGMRVLYHSAHRAPADVETGLGVEWRAELGDLLAEADFVSLHVSLNDSTRHLIDAARLATMKPTAVLVNTTRGPVVDEAALAACLASGGIFAAGLDVFEREPEVHPTLRSLDNCVIVPHLGSATVDTRLAMGMVAAENVIAALSGRRPPTLVNEQVWEAANRRRPRG